MGRSPAARRGGIGVSGGRVDGRRSAAWRFGWLWTAYGVSTFGTRFAFDAFALVALLVLHAGPAEVSLLAAVGRRSARSCRSRSGPGWSTAANAR